MTSTTSDHPKTKKQILIGPAAISNEEEYGASHMQVAFGTNVVMFSLKPAGRQGAGLFTWTREAIDERVAVLGGGGSSSRFIRLGTEDWSR